MKVRGVLVLGMHRSGTSAVAGVLTRLGLTASRPGDTVRGPWNPKGHYESQSLMALDDRLLREMGRTWWYPPPGGSSYAEVAAGIRTSPRQARHVFHRAYPKRPWVWKDPRACLLLPFWRRAFSDRVAAIVVVRNPLDVADSLARRNLTSTSFGVALWERYNRLLLEHAAGLPTLVTRFDDLIADPVGWSQRAAEFLSRTGIAVEHHHGAEGLGDAVDPELRHSASPSVSPEGSYGDALDLYRRLESVVGAWMEFAPPALPAEGPQVERELAAFGPDRAPQWRPPPAAADPRADAHSYSNPTEYGRPREQP